MPIVIFMSSTWPINCSCKISGALLVICLNWWHKQHCEILNKLPCMFGQSEIEVIHGCVKDSMVMLIWIN